MKPFVLFIFASTLTAITPLSAIAQTQEQVITYPGQYQTITLPAVLSGQLMYIAPRQQPTMLTVPLRYSNGADYIDYSKYPSLDYPPSEFIID